MEDLNLLSLESHHFLHSIYSQQDHRTLFYGLHRKEPRVPLLFETFPGSHAFHLRADPSPEPATEELRRMEELKGLLQSFVTSNIEKIGGQKFRCLLDWREFPSFRAALLHFQESHRHDFEQLLRVLLYDQEVDHLSFFFTKLFYSHLIYPPAPTTHPSGNQEYPSVLAPSFAPSKRRVESLNMVNNSIAVLAQQKMQAIGTRKTAANSKRNGSAFRLTRSRHSAMNKKRLQEVRQVFTLQDIYDLDLSLFPTAERAPTTPTPSTPAPSTGPSKNAPPAGPSKNAKRKRRKEAADAEKATAASQAKAEASSTLAQAEATKADMKRAEARAKEERARQEALKKEQAEVEAKQKKAEAELARLKEKKRQEQETMKRLQQQQEAQRREQEARQQKALEQQQRAHDERQRQAEEKKRQAEERERQKRVDKQADHLFHLYGAALTDEILEEVLCDLCGKLARRSIAEAKKQRAKQQQEQEQRQREAQAKQKKKEEREHRRHFRNEEADRLWSGLMEEVIREECKYLASDALRERRLALEQQQRHQREALEQQQQQQQQQHAYHHRAFGPPPPGMGEGMGGMGGAYGPPPPGPYQPGPYGGGYPPGYPGMGPQHAYAPNMNYSPASLPPAFRPPSTDSWEEEETDDSIPSYLAPSGGSPSAPSSSSSSTGVHGEGLGLGGPSSSSSIPPASSFASAVSTSGGPGPGPGHGHGHGHGASAGRYPPFGPPLPSSSVSTYAQPPSSSSSVSRMGGSGTGVPDQLQSELTALMGDEGPSPLKDSSAASSTGASAGLRWGSGGGSLMHQAINDYSGPYDAFGAPSRSPFSLGPEESSSGSSIFPHLSAPGFPAHGPPTLVSAEECGFDPHLTILLAHLPEKVLFRDINEFFRQANLPYEVCVKLRIHPLAADRCCYVQFQDMESMHQMLQLDNAPICGEPVRVLPARAIPSARPSAFGEPMGGFREAMPLRSQSVSPFGESEGRDPFGVPSVSASSSAQYHDPFMRGGPSSAGGSAYGGGGGPSFLAGNLGGSLGGNLGGNLGGGLGHFGGNPSPFGYSSYFDGPGLSFMGSGHQEEPRNSFYGDFGVPPPSSSSSPSPHDGNPTPRF